MEPHSEKKGSPTRGTNLDARGGNRNPNFAPVHTTIPEMIPTYQTAMPLYNPPNINGSPNTTNAMIPPTMMQDQRYMEPQYRAPPSYMIPMQPQQSQQPQPQPQQPQQQPMYPMQIPYMAPMGGNPQPYLVAPGLPAPPPPGLQMYPYNARLIDERRRIILATKPKKRKRKKYNEVERLYKCNFPNCNKAYGTLNHLNCHIVLQKHGKKRLPSEFKELREKLKKRRKLQREKLKKEMHKKELLKEQEESRQISEQQKLMDSARQRMLISMQQPRYATAAPPPQPRFPVSSYPVAGGSTLISTTSPRPVPIMTRSVPGMTSAPPYMNPANKQASGYFAYRPPYVSTNSAPPAVVPPTTTPTISLPLLGGGSQHPTTIKEEQSESQLSDAPSTAKTIATTGTTSTTTVLPRTMTTATTATTKTTEIGENKMTKTEEERKDVVP